MASEVKHPESIKNPKEASLEIDIRDKQIYREKIYRQILLAVMRNNYDGAVDNNYYLFRGDKVLCKSGLMSTSKEGIIIEDSSLKPNVEYRIQYTDGTRNYINIHNIKKILSNFQSSLDNVIKMEKLSMPTSEPTPYTVLVKYNNLEALFKGTKDILFGSLTDILKNHIDTTSLPINCSLLMVAATIPDIDPRMVDYIISHGADINYALTSGKTALIIAAENGNLYTVKQLLAANAEYDHTSLINRLTEKINKPSNQSMQENLLNVKTYLEEIAKLNGGKPTKKQHKKCSKKKRKCSKKSRKQRRKTSSN